MWTDVRLAVRGLRRQPGFTFLAVTALALGIGANCAIFSVVNAILLSPLPYSDPRHLYEIGSIDDKGRVSGASVADFMALAEDQRPFAKLSADRFWSFTLTDPGNSAERIYGRGLSAQTLPLLGVAPAIGRRFSDADFAASAPRVAVLSYRLWERRYSGDRKVIGREIRLDGESYAVIGVMPAKFEFPINVYDVYVPWIPAAAERANRNDRGYTMYARLSPGATLAQAQAYLGTFSAAMAKQFPDAEKNWHPRIGPTKLGSNDQFRTQLVALLVAVGFVLLIACLNVANLLLARHEGRKREIAVRIALGAGRWRIVRQLLTESLLLASVGAGAGLLLARLGAQLLVTSFPVRAPRPRFEYAGLDGSVLAIAIALTLLAAIGFGLAPAVQAARTDLMGVANRRGTRAWFRAALIVSETALSLILLAGAGLMVRSLVRLMDVQPGFHAENVLTVAVPMPSFLVSNTSRREVEAKQTSEYADLIDRIHSMPGVTAAAITTLLPLGNVEVHTQIGFEGDPNPKQDHGATLRCVSADYFRAMGIPVLKGRAFTEADSTDTPHVAMVNDMVARKYWPNEDAMGKRVNMSGRPQGPWLEVVGVAGGIRYRTLRDQPDPELYVPYKQYLGPAFAASLIVRSGSDPSSLAAAIRREIQTRYPDQPVGDEKLLSQIVADSVALPRFYAALLAAFAVLALVLACAGIYGVMSYSVAQRTREVGVRMALGATGGRVIQMVLRESLTLVAVGVALGVGGAIGLARLIESQLYATAPNDPGTLAAVSVTLMAVAAAACSIPAARAARVHPNVALRQE